MAAISFAPVTTDASSDSAKDAAWLVRSASVPAHIAGSLVGAGVQPITQNGRIVPKSNLCIVQPFKVA